MFHPKQIVVRGYRRRRQARSVPHWQAESLEGRRLLSAAFDPVLFMPTGTYNAIEAEPNGTVATAMPLTVGPSAFVVNGYLDDVTNSPALDTDYYKFTLAARSGVFLDIDARDDALAGVADTQITVFAADGTTQLATNDSGDDFYDFKLNDTGATTRSLDPALYVDLNAGTYIVRITASPSATSSSDGGSYFLKTFADDNYSASPPVFSSLPGAADTLLLDVDGHSATDVWGTYTIPAYDLNGNAAEWTPGERIAVQNIWRVVADDFAPFNINVTTSYGGSFSDGVGFRQVIGNSNGSQVNRTGSLGAAMTSAYATGGSTNNVGFTFASNFSSIVGSGGISAEIGGKAVELGNQSSQEFGHALGLKDYGGTNPQASGIMQSPDAGLNRERWKAGNTSNDTPPVVAQDDLAIISNSTNTFGYRADDHGDTTAAATVLGAGSGGIITSQGVIGQAADADYFRFTGSGLTTIFAGELEHVGNLKVELTLYDSSGTELTFDHSNGISGAIIRNLTAGTYYIAVRNTGITGAVGHYNLRIASLSASTATVDLLAATDSGISNSDDLTFRDNSTAAKNLQFSVTGTVPGATVTIYVDRVPVGSAIASGTTTTVTTNGTYKIPDNVPGTFRSVTAGQTESGRAASVTSGPPGQLSIRIDSVAPTVDVTDVTPDPRSTGVSSINVVFSEAVSGYDVTDMTLGRTVNNVATNVPLTASQSPTTFDNISYTVPNLLALTAPTGLYALAVYHSTTGIIDAAGNQLAADGFDLWENNNVAPTMTSFTDSPDPVVSGQFLMLSANGVADANGDAVTVKFYRESNGATDLQVGSGGDTLVGTVSSSPYFVPIPAPAVGTYTYYAQASDAGGASSTLSTTNTVQAPASATPGVPDLLAATDSGASDTDNITSRDNGAAASNLQFSVSGTTNGATVSIYADGTLIGSAVASGTTTTVTTSGSVDLADGVRSITARQTQSGKLESADSTALAVTIDTAAPNVTQVFVAGTLWNANFNNFLASSGAGDATFGIRILATEQTDELPWTNLNKVSIRFNEHVIVMQDDLIVRGVKNATYATNGFSYDSTTFTATWTLSSNIPNEKVLLELDADAGTGVTDVAGSQLDGEWTNPVAPAISADSYPSGNGTAGGDFLFRLNVLPGDVNRSGGSITGSDVTLVRNSQNSTPGAPGSLYTIFKDVNGSGSLLGSDVTLVRNNQGLALPVGEPSVPAPLIGSVMRKPLAAMPVLKSLLPSESLSRKRLTEDLL